jgi:hypothetical protein
MTLRLILSTTLTAVLFGGDLRAEDPLRSGPPVGAKNNRSGFRPQFVTGPGMPRCPV